MVWGPLPASPGPRSARCGPLARRPGRCPGLRSRPVGRPVRWAGRCGGLGPPPPLVRGSGGRLAYRRAVPPVGAAGRPPRAGPAAAWPRPAVGGLASPPSRPPGWGVVAPGLRLSAGPLAWVGGPCRAPPVCRAPSRPAPGAPQPGPIGRPGFAMGRRASSPGGRAVAATGRLRSRARPPGKG